MEIILDAIKSIEGKLDALNSEQHQIPDTYRSKIDGGIAPNHTTSTERILTWHVLDGIQCLKDRQPCFVVEYERPKFGSLYKIESTGRDSHNDSLSSSYISDSVRMVLLDTFERNINFWFPVLPLSILQKLRSASKHSHADGTAHCGTLYDVPMDCLGWIVLALGSACLTAEKRFESYPYSPSEDVNQAEAIGSLCFDSAYRMIPTALSEDTLVSTLCLFYMAVYMSYLQRPLQVISYLNSAAFKCQTLLRYQKFGQNSVESIEALRRVFYACFIIER
jgi:hypothetical protein